MSDLGRLSMAMSKFGCFSSTLERIQGIQKITLRYVVFLWFLFLLLILFVVLHVGQKFEEILKPMLNMESIKECMNILLLTYVMF